MKNEKTPTSRRKMIAALGTVSALAALKAIPGAKTVASSPKPGNSPATTANAIEGTLIAGDLTKGSFTLRFGPFPDLARGSASQLGALGAIGTVATAALIAKSKGEDAKDPAGEAKA